MIDSIVMPVMLLIFLGVPLLAVLDLRRPFQFKVRRCQHCDFDRSNLPADSRCPECGTPPGIHGIGRQAHDTFPSCRRCGHLLENLPWDTPCPECGLACAALPNFQRLPRKRHLTLRGFTRFFMGGLWGLAGIYLLLGLASLIN